MGVTGIVFLSVLGLSVTVFANSTKTDITSEKPCEYSMSVTLYYARDMGNGSLWDPVGRALYPPGTYWLEDSKNRQLTWKYRGCPCKLTRPCLRKCCVVGLDLTTKGKCVPTDEFVFKPNVTDDDGSNSRQVLGDRHFGLLFELQCQKVVLNPRKYPDDEFYIRASDGHLYLPKQNIHAISPADFCIDYVEESGEYLTLVCDKVGSQNQLDTMETPHWVAYICSVTMLLSTLFLMVTLFVYAIIPELRNTHGKSLMCNVSCLIVGYIFLSIVQLAGKEISGNSCKATAFIIQFSFLAAFFWMNIMCIDIYIKFRDFKPHVRYSKDMERKRFLLYSCYAWGSPFLLFLVTLLMDFVPGIPDSFIKPGFGKGRCWFNTKLGRLAYFYGPVAVLLVCNVVLFIITARKILRIKNETSILNASESRRHDEMHDSNKQRFNIYLKLFIVMGINWMMEVISWAVGGPGYVWFLTDIGNTLQGFFIFVILVWKERIRKLLRKRLRINKNQRDPSQTLWYSDGKLTSTS